MPLFFFHFHNYLRYHQNLVYGEAEDECPLCLEDTETSWHVVWECPAIARIRREVFGYDYFVHSVHNLNWQPKGILKILRGEPQDLLAPRGRST